MMDWVCPELSPEEEKALDEHVARLMAEQIPQSDSNPMH
jgi:hypothetical protein